MITELQGRLTGLREEGERIKLELIPVEELWNKTPDAKALSALTLYSELQKTDKLPQVRPLRSALVFGRSGHLSVRQRTCPCARLRPPPRETEAAACGVPPAGVRCICRIVHRRDLLRRAGYERA